jgi:hypothetical protein
MYWMAIIFIFCITNLPWWENRGPSIGKTLLNLTMIPTAFGGTWVDGAHWFLVRELQFYLFVVIVMSLGFARRLPQIFPIWAVILCIWNLLNLPRFEIWYLSGYFALLSGGAIIYSIRKWGWSKLRALGFMAWRTPERGVLGGCYWSYRNCVIRAAAAHVEHTNI